jgi:hypothetical protein
MMRFRPPFDKDDSVGVPDKNNYYIMDGYIYTEPFKAGQSFTTRLLVKSANIDKPLRPIEYWFYGHQVHEQVLYRTWGTFKPCFPSSFDEDGFPSGGVIDAPEYINIDGYDRCFDCARFNLAVCKYLYKFDRGNYNISGILKMHEKISEFQSLNFLKNSSTDGSAPDNPYLNSIPHGVYCDLPRCEQHDKMVQAYNDILYDKFFKKKVNYK